MKVSLAQINTKLGDFSSNSKKIVSRTQLAIEQGAEVVIFPECALFGYSPADLLERDIIVKKQLSQLNQLIRKLPKNIYVIFGAITNNSKSGKKYLNSAVIVRNNKIIKTLSKQLLPTYDVFDEERHFESGDLTQNIIKIGSKTFLIAICEDLWAWKKLNPFQHKENPLLKIKQKIDGVFVLNASPFSSAKIESRIKIAQLCALKMKAPVFYVNQVGAQDELIFDGGSFALNKDGKVMQQLSPFKEDLKTINLTMKPLNKRYKLKRTEELRQALTLGIQDFCNKINIKKVHFGLSGGIDSALVAALACDAIGSENVTALALPGPYSSKLSLQLAQKLADNLNIKLKVVDFNNTYKAMIKDLESTNGKIPFGLMHENIQARLRGDILMAHSNLHNSLLLNTSNKSELAVGYSTLYGDLCGGLAPIGDLLKQQVIDLCQNYNELNNTIPSKIITRPPTAELKPNQKDTDKLPPYPILDRIVHKIIVEKKPARSSLEKKILHMININEFKRWQAPPILRVSKHAFGQGRRMPIAHKAWF